MSSNDSIQVSLGQKYNDSPNRGKFSDVIINIDNFESNLPISPVRQRKKT